MSSRMEKYYKNPDNLEKRTQRNQELYQSINKSDIENYDVNSNVSVLDVPGNKVDLGQIKELLDERYKNPIRRQSIVLEEESEESVPLETKDYDLKVFLEKAKSEKVADYEKDRLKKLRDTQYDILNKLNLEKPEEEEKPSEAAEELMTMIQTITNNENTVSSASELDLFNDLVGEEDTVVVKPISEEQKVEYEKRSKEEAKNLVNSFYTGKLAVNEKDLEDFADLKDDINASSIVIKILIVIFAIVVIVGLLFLVDKIFTLGIF